MDSIENRYRQRDEADRLIEDVRLVRDYNYSVDLINGIICLLITQIESRLPINRQEIEIGNEQILAAWYLTTFSNELFYLLPDGRLAKHKPPIKIKEKEKNEKGEMVEVEKTIEKGFITEIELAHITEINPNLTPSYKLIMALLGALRHRNMFDNFGIEKDPKWDLTLEQIDAAERYALEKARTAKPDRTVRARFGRFWNEFTKVV